MKSHESPRVVIGMDPHKRSVTIEVMTGDESVVGGGRFATDAAGYRAMLEYLGAWPDRVWAIEGCNGIGRFGVPEEVLTDNGKQFTGRFSKGGEVLFDKICRKNAITHRLTQPASRIRTARWSGST